MKAFVINEDQIKNTLMMLAGALLFAFVLGYYFGTQSSSALESSNQVNENTGSEKGVTPSEDQAVEESVTANPESRKEDEIAAQKAAEKQEQVKKEAAKKELARKELARKEAARKEALKKEAAKKEQARKQALKIELAKKEKAKKEKARKEQIKREQAQKEQAKREQAQKEQAQKEAEKIKAISAKTNSSDVVSSKEVPGPDVNDAQTSLEPDDIDVETKVYSIQAGMFASEANANSFIDKLADKKFDAYVSSFMSNSGATKYNVRVGRFAERDQARLLLKEFQKSFSSPAYVVITR